MAKSNKVEAQLQKLREENEILRDAATYDAETIRKLKQEVRELKASAPSVVRLPDDASLKKIEELEFKVGFLETERDNAKDEAVSLRDVNEDLLQEQEALKRENAISKDGLLRAGEEIADIRAQRDELQQKLQAAEARTFEARESKAVAEAAEKIHGLERDLTFCREKIADLEKILDNGTGLTRTQKARRWRLIKPEGPFPPEGERVFICSVNFRRFCEDIAGRRNNGKIYCQYMDALYVGDGRWQPGDVPPGHVVVAWQPLHVMSDPRIENYLFMAAASLTQDFRAFYDVVGNMAREKMNPGSEKKYVIDLQKKVISAINQRLKRRSNQIKSMEREMMA